MITKERVEELLHYDPETGYFFWKKLEGRGHRELGGKVAGCLAPNGYIMLGIDRKLYRAHRVVFLLENGEFPKQYVDHIDGDKKNNKRDNLRLVTQQQNAYNAKPHKDSVTKVKGVYWDKERELYVAQIWLNGKHIHLGRYETLEEASVVAKNSRIENHGVYARHV